MKVTRLVKRLGRVINTGNYASIRIEAEVEARLDEKESVEEADQKLFDVASKILANDLKRIKEKQQS
jgi:replicative DNA helicase